ncbi:hypothetical protein ACN4DS_10490, partial [Corynebacterium macclintockiae]
MTRVQGDLKIITGTAEAATEVRVRSKVSRPVPGGWLMDMSDRRPVFDGKVDLELLPGACVLVAISGGLPSEAVDLIVPESGTASLEACIRAAKSAGDLERDALDELRGEVASWVSKVQGAVATVGESAKDAKASADAAKVSETNAGKSASAAKTSEMGAKDSATAAAGSASAAKVDADKASASATTAQAEAGKASTSASTASDAATRVSASESAAATSATNAAKSASAAKVDADKASASATTAQAEAGKASTSASTASDAATRVSA